jgi:hypothetical protein
MGINIVSISLYCNDQRVRLSPDSAGKFLIPNFSTAGGRIPLIRVTAKQLISDERIKYMDPVLTLDDGSKLRVYQGGDPSGLLTQSISLIEKHDKRFIEKNKSRPGKSYAKGLTYGSCSGSDFLMLDWPDDDWY